jgi:aminobenzoyl-glutamate utilization protein B
MAAAAPDKGRSALDGVVAMNTMGNLMRVHVPQEARIHYVLTKGGTAANIVPDFAETEYYVRHPDPRVVMDIVERVQKAAQGAAMGTGTTVDWEFIHGSYSLLPNPVLGKLLDANLRRVGPPSWTPEEVAFAEKLQKTLPSKKLPPVGEAQEIQPYTFDTQKYSATDSGDVSWVTPLGAMTAATYAPGTPNHSWQAVAFNGMSIGLKGAEVAAETLALTAAQLFHDPALIDEAKAAFDESREGFEYKPLIGDREPPLDYRKDMASAAAR